ncbi:MAG: hypothetical protein N2114_05415, partial [Candidatus Goldbacteria bacterium]|nr:hypothetical protein [Candidatus Goldiibacteriota bacterium]
LKAVFWNYPELTEPNNLKKLLKENNDEEREWILQRFMEHGRVVDTINYFGVETIAEKIKRLRLTPYTKKRDKDSGGLWK